MGDMAVGMLMMLVMVLFPLALLAGLVVLAVWLIRQLGPSSRHRSDEALDILRERYASGEISREEFERIHEDLSRRAQGGLR